MNLLFMVMQEFSQFNSDFINSIKQVKAAAERFKCHRCLIWRAAFPITYITLPLLQ